MCDASKLSHLMVNFNVLSYVANNEEPGLSLVASLELRIIPIFRFHGANPIMRYVSCFMKCKDKNPNHQAIPPFFL